MMSPSQVTAACVVVVSLLAPVSSLPKAHYDRYHPYYHSYHSYHYYGECELDSHCSSSLACSNYYCRDPCIGACGYNANCRVSHLLQLLC